MGPGDGGPERRASARALAGMAQLAASGSAAVSSRRHLWLVRRLALGVLVLLVTSVIVFAATQALPSDPARAILGRQATPEQLTGLRAELGLDRPLVTQYLTWLGGVVTGDLGESLSSHASVTSLLGERLPNSLSLMLCVVVLAIPIALVLGAFTALRRDGIGDRAVLVTSLTLTALPEFVIGMIMIFVFGTTIFAVLPAVSLIPPGELVVGHPAELVLPVLTLMLVVGPYLYRLMRAAMIDVLESEYVTMARLKGVPERQVLSRHALPNAVIPVIQGSALALTWLLGGIVLVEFVFRFPGLGTLLTDALANRDLPVIQGVVLTFAAGAVAFNLVADVLTVYLTPKLRTAGRKP